MKIITKINIEGRSFSIYEQNGQKIQFSIDELVTIFIKNNKTKWLFILFPIAGAFFLIYYGFRSFTYDSYCMVKNTKILVNHKFRFRGEFELSNF